MKITQKGEILLEFRRSTEVAMHTHRSKLRSLLAEEVEVNAIIEETIFELRYLDEVTTEEIIAARKDQREIESSALRKIGNVPEVLGRR